MNDFKFSNKELQDARDIGATHYDLDYEGCDHPNFYRFGNGSYERYTYSGVWKTQRMDKNLYKFLSIIPYPECAEEKLIPVTSSLPEVLKAMVEDHKVYYNSDGSVGYLFVNLPFNEYQNYFMAYDEYGVEIGPVCFDMNKLYEKTVTYSVKVFNWKNTISKKLIGKNGSISKGLETYLNDPDLNCKEMIDFAREILKYNINTHFAENQNGVNTNE